MNILENLLSIFKKIPAQQNLVEVPADTTERGDEAKQAGHPWIGVDLDGTLATFHRWRGLNHIGTPVPVMMTRVRYWLEEGYQVKIVTARASIKEGISPVKAWLEKHGLPDLEVVSGKDFDMIELWDDRAIQVLPNSGKVVLRPSIIGRPQAPLMENEIRGETCVAEAAAPTVITQSVTGSNHR
jgi:hypothetical protein